MTNPRQALWVASVVLWNSGCALFHRKSDDVCAVAPKSGTAQWTQTPDSGVLEGLVTGNDALGRTRTRPLADVTVSADGTTHREVMSDSAGHFRLTGLKAGTYRLRLLRVAYNGYADSVTIGGGGVRGVVRLSVASTWVDCCKGPICM